MPRLSREAAKRNVAGMPTATARDQPTRRYVAPAGGSPSEHVVSSAEVREAGAHEIVRIWSRGGLAGELVVGRGDGERICCLMFMLEPEAAR